MARKKQSRGACGYCGRTMTKAGIAKHLQSCEKRNDAISGANAGSRKDDTIYHLQIQDNWSGDYWLHVEISGNAMLEDLDQYLRAIWLECCGHLSEFSVGRMGNSINMNRRIDNVFARYPELIHVYDFGTTSETRIKVVATRRGNLTTDHPITLMARNDPPETHCIECNNPAAWLCLECLYEHEGEGMLCDKHAENHPHDEYGEPMPVVNSPRMGMCGYTGPAEPPY